MVEAVSLVQIHHQQEEVSLEKLMEAACSVTLVYLQLAIQKTKEGLAALVNKMKRPRQVRD